MLINSASTVFTRLLSMSVLVWLWYYLLGKVSAEEYSLLPVVNSIMMFAPLLTTVLTSGIGRYIIEAYAKNDDERVTQITSTMFPILTACGAVFLIAGWTFSWFIGDVLNIEEAYLWDARVMMAMLMFSAAVRLPLAPFGVGLHARQRFVMINVIAVSVEIVRIALLFSLLFGVGPRVIWVVTASTVAELIYLIVIQVASRRALPSLRFERTSIHWPIAAELTSFGGWNSLANLADTVRTSADPIILNRLAHPSTVAVDLVCYGLGSMVTSRISVLSNAARGPLLPALTALHALNDEPKLRSMFLRGGRLALWMVMLPAVPIMVFNKELVQLYAGPQYAQAGIVMVLSLLYLPITYGTTMTTAIVNARGRIKTWALIVTAMNSLNLVLTFYLVGWLKWGAVGSVSATLASVAIFYPLFVFPFSLNLVGVSWARWGRETMLPGLLPSAVATVTALVVKFSVSADTWLKLGLAACPAVLVYVAVLYFCMHDDDRADILRLVQRVRPGGKAGTSTGNS